MAAMFNKIKKTIENSLLCLKYPFLYPRNRWDGKHHAYKLNNILHKLDRDATYEFDVTATLHDPREPLVTHAEGHGVTVDLDIKNRKLIIKNHLETKEHDLKSILWNSDDKFTILGMTAFWNNSYNIIVYVKTTDENDNSNYGFHYESVELLNNKRKLFYYKVLKWIDTNIFDKIFFVPSSTELDAMPDGWRKVFGLQMCEEIKQSLLKSGGRKALRAYRILQIKEKFGGLRWYDSNSNEEVWKIISKYEDLSYKICINCGKPAEYISKGWISPYCGDCIGNKQDYVKITGDDAWDKAMYPGLYENESKN